MGNMHGYRQVSVYLEPEVYDRAIHVAKMLNQPMYEFITKALQRSIIEQTTTEQRKALDVLTGSVPASKREAKSKVKSNKRKVDKGNT